MSLPLLPLDYCPLSLPPNNKSTIKPEYMYKAYNNIPPPPTYNVAMRVEINKLFALRNKVSSPPGLECILVINLNQVLTSMRHPSPPSIDTVMVIHLDQPPIKYLPLPPGLESIDNTLTTRPKTAIRQWLATHPPPKHIPPVP